MRDKKTKHIGNLFDLLNLIQEYKRYLVSKNLEFDNDGMPILKKEFFLDEYPDLVVPFERRNSKVVIDKRKTVLCFYCPDELIYRRLPRLLDDMDIYREFMGVISFDVTVTKDMDVEWQELIIMLNILSIAVLCVNGIKCVLNTRIGSEKTICLLDKYPKQLMWASGFLGCKKDEYYDYRYIDKILILSPSKLIIYGKEDLSQNEKLDMMGIDYRYYKDYHLLCKEVQYGR